MAGREHCLLFALLVGFVASNIDDINHDKAEFTTARKYTAEGDTLVLNCTLTAKAVNYTAHELTFDTNWGATIDPKSINVVSERTVIVTINNISMAWNNKMMYCHHATWWIQKFALVYVGRKPLVSQITECVLDNWQALHCYWSPARQTQVNHTMFHSYEECVSKHFEPGECMNTTLLWTQIDNLPEDQWSKCLPTSGDNCTVPVTSGLDLDKPCKVKVIVENILGSSSSPVVVLDLASIVRPGPVQGLQSTPLTKTQSTLSWALSSQRPLEVRLAWRSEDDLNATWRVMSLGTGVTLHNLTLEPYTHYDVWVDVRSLYGGFWSNKTSLSFLSPVTEPVIQPSTVADAFELIPNSKTDRADVAVYWKPLTRRQYGGPDFQYVLKVRGEGQLTSVLPVSADVTCKMVTGGQQIKDTSIEVVARNSVGYSDVSAVALHVPGASTLAPALPRYRLVANGRASVRVDVYGGLTDNTATLRLFWCDKLINHLCQGVLQWSEALVYPYSEPIDFGSALSYDNLDFAVSVTLGQGRMSSGMSWYRQCVHDSPTLPQPPANLHVSVDAKDNTTLTLIWNHPPCVHGATGLLTGYLVTWLPVDSNATLDTADSVTLPFDQTKYTLPQLPHPQYTVSVMALSDAGQSPPASVHLITPAYLRSRDAMSVALMVCGGVVLLLLLLILTLCMVRKCFGIRKWYKFGLSIEPPKKISNHYVSYTAHHSAMDAYNLDELLPPGVHKQSCGHSEQSDDSGLDVKSSTRDHGAESDVSLLTTTSPLLPHASLVDTTMDDVFTDLHLLPGDLHLSLSDLNISPNDLQLLPATSEDAPASAYNVPRVQDTTSEFPLFFIDCEKKLGHLDNDDKIDNWRLNTDIDSSVNTPSTDINRNKLSTSNEALLGNGSERTSNSSAPDDDGGEGAVPPVTAPVTAAGGYVVWCDVPVFTQVSVSRSPSFAQ